MSLALGSSPLEQVSVNLREDEYPQVPASTKLPGYSRRRNSCCRTNTSSSSRTLCTRLALGFTNLVPLTEEMASALEWPNLPKTTLAFRGTSSSTPVMTAARDASVPLLILLSVSPSVRRC